MDQLETMDFVFPKLHPLIPAPGRNNTIRGSGGGTERGSGSGGGWRNSASFCPTCAVSVMESLMRDVRGQFPPTALDRGVLRSNGRAASSDPPPGLSTRPLRWLGVGGILARAGVKPSPLIIVELEELVLL